MPLAISVGLYEEAVVALEGFFLTASSVIRELQAPDALLGIAGDYTVQVIPQAQLTATISKVERCHVASFHSKTRFDDTALSASGVPVRQRSIGCPA